MLRRNISLLLLCAATAYLGGCDGNSQNPTDKLVDSAGNRPLARGLPGEPRTLDPQLADDTFSYQVVWDLYEGLTALDRDGSISPGIASSWTVDSTGKVYTFALRPEAKWSDGELVSADEFVAGLRRAVDPATASGSADLIVTIKNASEIIQGKKPVRDLGVSAPNERSVRIELEQPAPFILQILADPIAAPLHRGHSATPAANGIQGIQVATDGPYTVETRIPNSFIDLKRNPNYWNAKNVPIEHVRYVNAESETTELNQYAAGQLDVTYSVPPPDLQRVAKEFGDQLQTQPILGTMYLALNMTEGPLRASRDLRQALSMAIDRDLIAEHLTLGVIPAYAFVARGIQNYEPPAYAWATWSRDHRLSYARSLYARSGYSAEHPLHLRLYFNTGEGNQRIMVAVAGAWKQNLGVETQLLYDEFRVFLNGRKDRSRWDAARLGWWADYNDPSSFLEIFSSTSNQNDPGYENIEFNSLLDAARSNSDASERMKTLRDSETVLLNDYPIIPIYFYTAARLVKPYVGGAQISPLRRTYSKHLFWRTSN
jgi:ABC-type oligopeptide transport system substrate-binding subunit